jgi:hypothetical protein
LTLDDFCLQLRRFSSAEIGLAELHAFLTPILATDPLDIEDSVDAAWDSSPHETRLLWRLVYLFEAGTDEGTLREEACRILDCRDATRDAAVTHELLPILLDQVRFCDIIDKYARGIISRTGFLNVVAESGYPGHVRLWLERATMSALQRMAARLEGRAYGEVAQALERRPA